MPDPPADPPKDSPLSLSRLTAAFARMLGSPAPDAEGEGEASDPPPAASDAVTPEGVVEAMLFVGRSDGSPIGAEEIASAMRDVSPDEVEEIVERLNAGYAEDDGARRIESVAGGYRMTLAPGFARLGDRLTGRVKPARLSPTAMQVLSIVAYRQPIGADGVEALRGTRSDSALALLVRRGLLRRDPPAGEGEGPRYATTDRFLRLFDLPAIDQLPRAAEFDD